jgi:PST family polysaccharide transporter
LCSESPLPGLVSSSFCIKLVGTIPLCAVLLPFAIATRDPLSASLFGIAVISNMFTSFEVLEVELLNRQKGVITARVGFFQTLIGTISSTVALIIQAPLLVFGLLPLLQSVAKAILLFRASSIQSFKSWLQTASLSTAKLLIRRGLPLMISSFAIMIYMRSDQVMLEWLKGSSEVGQYTVAVRVAESIYFLPVILSQTFMPRLGAESNSKLAKPLSKASFRQLYRLSWLLGIIIVAVSLFLLPPFIFIVFGEQYIASGQALQFLAPAGFAVATGCASEAWLNINGYVDHIAKRSIIGAASNILLNIALIPSYGIFGAATATSISYLISVHFYGLIDSRSRSATLFLLAPL